MYRATADDYFDKQFIYFFPLIELVGLFKYCNILNTIFLYFFPAF